MLPWHAVLQLVCCAESLAQAQRERDNTRRLSSELEAKLVSADADARALAEPAVKSVEEATKVREREVAQRPRAVANSLSGRYFLP